MAIIFTTDYVNLAVGAIREDTHSIVYEVENEEERLALIEKNISTLSRFI